MISVEQLSFGYSDRSILDLPELRIEKGQHFLILGSSGSGKTTLLHILGGLLAPLKGKVSVDGEDIYGQGGAKLDKFRGKNIGLVFQKAHLISALSVLDNLLLTQYLAGEAQNKARAKEVLSELNLEDKLNKKVKSLSQGEQQRVTIARALLNKPKLILADEPTASLDDKNANTVIQLLKEQAEKYEASLLIATHDHRVKEQFELQLNLDTL